MSRIKWLWEWVQGKASLSPHALWYTVLAPLCVALTTLLGAVTYTVLTHNAITERKAQDVYGIELPVPVEVNARESRGGFLLSFETPRIAPGGSPVEKVSFDIGNGFLPAKVPTLKDGDMRYFLSGSDVPRELLEQRMIHATLKLIFEDGTSKRYRTKNIDLVRLE